MKKKFIISGGGTGGHIYPALAIADALKVMFPDADFLFIGASDRMEMEKIPQNGYEIIGLWICGIDRKITLKNLVFPFKLISSLWKANSIIKKFKPNVVIGTGGFASGPTLIRANANGIPTLIQEQNSFPGITNKLLAKKANKICVAYASLDKFFPLSKIIKTGNPVRQDLLSITSKREEAIRFFKLDKNKKTLLVIGGSLGARNINKLIENQKNWFVGQDIQVIWQTGKLYYNEYKNKEVHGVQVHEFLHKMDLAYAASDMIISRAGAGTISELCIVGKPVVFIPSPNVTEDHQTKNAQALVDEKAGIILKENELERFQIVFSGLMDNEDRQLELGRNIKKLALPNATKDIVNEVVKLLK